MGTWKVVIPGYTAEKTETYYETETYYVPSVYDEIVDDSYTDSNGRWHPGWRKVRRSTRVPQTRQVPRTRTIPIVVPESDITFVFNGKTYTKIAHIGGKTTTSATGAFYYNGNTIELDDGTILNFVNQVLTDADKHNYIKQ